MKYMYLDFDGTKNTGDGIQVGVMKMKDSDSEEEFEKWLIENFPFRYKRREEDKLIYKVARDKKNWIYEKDVIDTYTMIE